MKLYYYQFPDGVQNFGDNLNAWLWPQLIPHLLDDDERAAFVGIGTLLNERLLRDTPRAQKRAVFSTGAGYGDAPPLGADDRVYCVRGPLTAAALGLPRQAAVTDGALLLRRLWKPSSPKRVPFAYMPHIGEIADRAWASVCVEAGFGYIDPRWPTERVLGAIGETDVLLTEAMHGAIAADALRVPWVAVTTRPDILPFKWEDWCRSIGVAYQPVHLDSLHNPRRTGDVFASVRAARYQFRRCRAAAQLGRIARTARPHLSDPAHLECLTEQLEERLDRFAHDVMQGDYAH